MDLINQPVIFDLTQGIITPKNKETIWTRVNKTTKKSSEQEVLRTSIKNMPGFSAKLKVKDTWLLYRTATETLAIKEGIPFCTFAQF